MFVWSGLECLVLSFCGDYIWAGLVAIPFSLLSRFISVSSFVGLLRFRRKFSDNAIRILTWGGLRGGISVALVLSMPKGDERDLILTMTYVVVIFSILVQGLTVGKLIERVTPKQNDLL